MFNATIDITQVAKVAACAGVGMAAAPFLAAPALGLVGFSAAGPVAGRPSKFVGGVASHTYAGPSCCRWHCCRYSSRHGEHCGRVVVRRGAGGCHGWFSACCRLCRGSRGRWSGWGCRDVVGTGLRNLARARGMLLIPAPSSMMRGISCSVQISLQRTFSLLWKD